MMLPRLQAEEALAAVVEARAGDPWTEAKAAKKIVTAWQRVLDAPAPVDHAPKRHLTAEEFAQRMALLGMEAGNGGSGH